MEDRVPCQIKEGVFLGFIEGAKNKAGLKGLNVTHILSVGFPLKSTHTKGFIYKFIRLGDTEDTRITDYFDECINFVDDAKMRGSGILVHCLAGMSRSVTIVVAYLMKKHGMSLSQALEHVRRRRPLADPNSGFILQLENFEKALQGPRT